MISYSVFSYDLTITLSFHPVQHAGAKTMDRSLDVSDIDSSAQQSTLIRTGSQLGMHSDPHMHSCPTTLSSY